MSKGRLAHAAALALAFFTPQVAGAETFAPPVGCEAFLTVQMTNCTTSVLWRCDAAPEGDIWDALFTEDGLQSVVNYDREYQWIDANYLWDGAREQMVQPADDPISLDTLLATGVDTFAFFLDRTAPDEGQRRLRVIGADELTGEEVAIDGVRLLATRAEFHIMNPAGEAEYHSRGTQFVSPEMRVFFLDRDIVIENGEQTEYDSAPIDFILPGEPGFADTTPLFGCSGPKKAALHVGAGGGADAG
jgi:hypothetical protein